MRVLINTSNNLTGGSLQVAISFINECKEFCENEYIVVLGTNISKQINPESFPSNFRFYKIKTKVFYLLSKQLKKIEKMEKPDRVFTVFGPAYWRPRAYHIIGFANPYYGRNTNYIRHLPLKEKLILFIKKKLHVFYMNRDADIIVSETKEATDAFKRVFKRVKKFEIVLNNCSSFYWNYNKQNLKNQKSKKEFSLLTLSNYRPNKNLECIPKVIEELHRQNVYDVRFILTIDKEVYNKKFSAYKDSIINIGFQKAEACPAVYEKCDAMFLPSYLECFSASYPEAMIMEKPILTSDLEFARVICQGAALFFNPDDPVDIANKIIQLKASSLLQKDLILKGQERLKVFPTPKEKTQQYLKIITNELN